MGSMKKIAFLFAVGLVLLVTACGGGEAQLPASTPGAASFSDIGGLANLVDALRGRGTTVETGETVNQPFLPVQGRILTVDGVDVQVYEFATSDARQEVSATITEGGDVIGAVVPEWIDQPNFWAQGRLIVLYIGRDEPTINLLSFVLGSPLTGEGLSDLPPRPIQIALEQMAADLGVAPEQLSVEEIDEKEWPDACLGLPEPNEECAEEVTAGWLALVDINGQIYELHTNDSGEVARWREFEGDMG